MRKDIPSVLVAILPKVSDWELLQEKLWYRIPIDSAPSIIKNREAEYIAFYHTAQFKEDLKWKVVSYAKIKRIIIASRKELFPDEFPISIKAEKTYFKIEFDELKFLIQPIISRHGHRGTFIPTTYEKFFSGTTDFNYLYKSSFLERDMEKIMDEMGIEYEREYCIILDKKKFYYLDFVIFCKKGYIDIECDGDEFHMGNKNVHLDKTRNNLLTSVQWAILRYTTKHFEEERSHMKSTIYKTIDKLGGLIKVAEPDITYYPKINSKGQGNLFQK